MIPNIETRHSTMYRYLGPSGLELVTCNRNILALYYPTISEKVNLFWAGILSP